MENRKTLLKKLPIFIKTKQTKTPSKRKSTDYFPFTTYKYVQKNTKNTYKYVLQG